MQVKIYQLNPYGHATRARFPEVCHVSSKIQAKSCQARRTKYHKHHGVSRTRNISVVNTRSVVVSHLKTSTLETTLEVETLINLGAIKNALQKQSVLNIGSAR